MTSRTNKEKKKGHEKTLLISIVALSLPLSGWVAANTPYARQKVVDHVNYFDVKRSIGAMRNAQNHIDALAEGNAKSDSYSTEIELNS